MAVSRKTIIRRVFNPRWWYFLRRSIKPISHNYGASRGTPVDRYYIEKFLAENAKDIKGRCLEVESNIYTKKFGHPAHVDILDIDKNNQQATILGDLRDLKNISDDNYDCIILTQVLQFIDDGEAAVRECFRILKTGGVLLATLPTLSRIDVRASEGADHWRWTKTGAEYLFSNTFKKENLTVKNWGNILTGIGFWIGQSVEEFSQNELDYKDNSFPILASVRAIK